VRLEGRIALVTGAGRGIGRGIARVYAREGASVVVVDRDATTAREAADELGGLACVADLTVRAEVDAAVAAAIERYGRLDVLTQNAGVYPTATLDEMTDAQWDLVQSINIKSLLYVVQACLPHLRARGGGARITVTSSITGPRVGYPGLTHYAASKAAINGFIRAAALELAPDGITVNGVEPGTVLTEGVLEELATGDVDPIAAIIPLKRLGTPEDIAHAHLFLASDEAQYITGQTIVVDGGQILPETPWAVT
jgi:3-oxoacyl-[acyl-carrier protein] reductase